MIDLSQVAAMLALSTERWVEGGSCHSVQGRGGNICQPLRISFPNLPEPAVSRM